MLCVPACVNISFKSDSILLSCLSFGLPCSPLQLPGPLLAALHDFDPSDDLSKQFKRFLSKLSLIAAIYITFLIASFIMQSRCLMPKHHLSIFTSITLTRNLSFLVMDQHTEPYTAVKRNIVLQICSYILCGTFARFKNF